MTTTKRLLATIRAAFPECHISHGWHLDGAGPARFGWAVVHPSGRVRYLGRTAYDALQGLLREVDARTAAAQS